MITRIGILGGTFDPVHNGHLYLAKKACERLDLSKVIFIPTYMPPHKKGIKVTLAKHRYNMLKLAIKNNKKFKLSGIEIKRRGKSYSIDTLRELWKKYGARQEIFFITGSDSLREINKWRNLKEILALSRFVIVERPGFKIGSMPEGFIKLRINAKDISSTEIRKCIQKRRSIQGIIPREVKDYISMHKLYAP